MKLLTTSGNPNKENNKTIQEPFYLSANCRDLHVEACRSKGMMRSDRPAAGVGRPLRVGSLGTIKVKFLLNGGLTAA